jgi:hypothetical protein
VTTRLPPLAKVETKAITCSVESCYDDCANEHQRECDNTMLQRTCEAHYGANATYSGASDCQGEEVCGVCRFTAYLDTVCVVVDAAANGQTASFDHVLHSCFYPFGPHDHKYAAHAVVSSVTVQMRSHSDPFLTMQRITEGTMDIGSFGRSWGTAILLLTLGCGMVIASVIGLCCYACCCRESRNRECQHHDVAPMAAPAQHDATVIEMNPIDNNGYHQGAYPTPGAQQQRREVNERNNTRTADPIEGVIFVGNYRDEADPNQVPTHDDVVKPAVRFA